MMMIRCKIMLMMMIDGRNRAYSDYVEYDDYDAIYNYANEEDENEDIEDCLDNEMK